MGCNISKDVKVEERTEENKPEQIEAKMNGEEKPPVVNQATDGCDPSEEEEAAKKIQAHFRGYKTRKELDNMKASQDDDKNSAEPVDPELEKAATRIQASFRGHKVRKEMKVTVPEESPQESDEVLDIDLNDPELVQAATKIQTTFRGYKARKKM